MLTFVRMKITKLKRTTYQIVAKLKRIWNRKNIGEFTDGTGLARKNQSVKDNNSDTGWRNGIGNSWNPCIMPTIFTRIIQGEIPCHKIAETSNCFAFLDIRPWLKGHTLVIPKTEVDYFFDLPQILYMKSWICQEKLPWLLRKLCLVPKWGGVIGLKFPHAHLHLVPIATIGIWIFEREMSLSDKEMEELTTQIRSRISWNRKVSSGTVFPCFFGNQTYKFNTGLTDNKNRI